MKRLLMQQKQILRNYQDTKGATLIDYLDAINQHLQYTISVAIIRPHECEIRKVCDDMTKCLSETIDFKSIDGAFCSKCGEVYPF